jgi:hypothetical protein
MIKVVVLAVIELKQVLKIVEDLADYIALGVTGEIVISEIHNLLY